MPYSQLPIDFETPGREEFALLVGAMTAAGADEKVQSLVKLVYNMQQKARGMPLCWSLARIGKEFGRNRDTARRWVHRAAELGLVTLDERRHVEGGQRTHSLAINWEGVRRLALSPRRTGRLTSETPVPTPSAGGVAKLQTGVAKPLRRRSGFATPIKEYQSFSSQLKPPPTPSADAKPAAVSWEGVGVELKKLGMVKRRAAVAAMISAGGRPADAMALVAYWRGRPGAWDVGALFVRMDAWTPSQGVEEAWPPPPGTWRDPEEIAAAAARQQAAIDEQLRKRAAYQAERAANGFVT